MLKRLSLIIIAFLCLFGPQARGAYRLANRGKLGLNIYPIERILKMSDDQVDLGTAALLISRQWGSPNTLHRYRYKLDDMAQ